jgi:hypothetical protein
MMHEIARQAVLDGAAFITTKLDGRRRVSLARLPGDRTLLLFYSLQVSKEGKTRILVTTVTLSKEALAAVVSLANGLGCLAPDT